MIFFDAHLHFYTTFSCDKLFESLSARAARLAPGATVACAMMQRAGQPSFREMIGAGGERWRLARQVDEHALVMSDGRRELYIFTARQVAARERIEALGFLGAAEVEDGLPLAESLVRLRAGGMVAALAWGLGKWLGGRGRLVRELIAQQQRGELLICDSALRPSFWGEPLAMREARRRGLRLVYGSDPLPRAGDDGCAGMYATLIDATLDSAAPSASLRASLLNGDVTMLSTGSRHGFFATLKRLRK